MQRLFSKQSNDNPYQIPVDYVVRKLISQYGGFSPEQSPLLTKTCFKIIAEMSQGNIYLDQNRWLYYQFLSNFQLLNKVTPHFYIKSETDKTTKSVFVQSGTIEIYGGEVREKHYWKDYDALPLAESVLLEARLIKILIESCIHFLDISIVISLFEINPFLKTLSWLPVAVSSGRFATVKYFLSQTPDVNLNGNVDFVKYSDGDVYAYTEFQSALSRIFVDAVIEPDKAEEMRDVLYLLLDAGADPNKWHYCRDCDDAHTFIMECEKHIKFLSQKPAPHEIKEFVQAALEIVNAFQHKIKLV